MDSQYPNGAWPQWYPLRGGYHDYYTFNDNTINDCIAIMIKIHERYGDQQYLDRINLAGDFVIASQIAGQPGWAQQYNSDMEPDWARAFEPPAVCSAVTSRNIRTLVDMALYTGDERYFGPIPAAIAWLDTSKLSENLWARFYELGTNVPIYGDRDGLIHYTLEEISEERRTGYSWQSSYGVAGNIRYYENVLAVGIDAYNASLNVEPTQQDLESRLDSRAGGAETAVNALDSEGRWVNDDGWLYSADFVNNFNDLVDYVETYNALHPGAPVVRPMVDRVPDGAGETVQMLLDLRGRLIAVGRYHRRATGAVWVVERTRAGGGNSAMRTVVLKR
jgi:hypothetical protein